MIPWFPWRILFACLTLLCLAASATSSLRGHPHSLAYFNEAAGGPGNGWRHMLGSNFDWGQDLIYLKQWIVHRPHREPIWVACFGCIDPNYLNVDYKPVPLMEHDETMDEYRRRLPAGLYAVSVRYLLGSEAGGFYHGNNRCLATTVKNKMAFNGLIPVGRCAVSVRLLRKRSDEASADRCGNDSVEVSRESVGT